jgi:hypothetical protein
MNKKSSGERKKYRELQKVKIKVKWKNSKEKISNRLTRKRKKREEME